MRQVVEDAEAVLRPAMKLDLTALSRTFRLRTSEGFVESFGPALIARVATDAPGGGWHWGAEAHHSELPRGNRVHVGTVAPLEQLLFGPAESADGRVNLIGALKRSMATTGYSDLKEFQRVEVVIAPYHRA